MDHTALMVKLLLMLFSNGLLLHGVLVELFKLLGQTLLLFLHIVGVSESNDILSFVFQEAIFKRFLYDFKTSLYCTFSPIVKFLGFFACDCGTFAGSPTDCLPSSLGHKVAEDIFFSVSADCISTEKAQLCFFNETIDINVDHANVTVNVILHEEIIIASSNKRTTGTSGTIIVYNSMNQLIGQIVSDVVQINATGSNSGTIFGGSFQLCIPLSNTITQDSFFGMKDFAYKSSLSANLVAMGTTVSVENGQWCANVNQNGYYAAAMTSSMPYDTMTFASKSTGGAMNLVYGLLLLFIVLLLN